MEMEDRQRRNNISIIGGPEDAKQSTGTKLISKTIIWENTGAIKVWIYRLEVSIESLEKSVWKKNLMQDIS